MRQKALKWWRNLSAPEQNRIIGRIFPNTNKSFGQIAMSSFRIEQMYNEAHNAEKQMVLVPEGWLEGLLEYAKKLESEDYEYGLSNVNDRIHLTTALLRGYAMSAENILKSNERI